MMKKGWIGIGIAVLLWGCGVNHKGRKQVRGREQIEMEMIGRDSMDIRSLYQRLTGRKILLNRFELAVPDTLGRQYVNAVIQMVVEEDIQEEEGKVLRSGSDMRIDYREDRDLEKESESVIETGEGFLFRILLVLLCGVIGVSGYIIIKK